MNLRNVLRAYSLLRQLSDDESALLETLRQTNETERALLVETLSDKPQKKSSKKSAGKGGGKSKHASSLQQQIQNAARGDSKPSPNQCIAIIDDNGSEMLCAKPVDDNVHHIQNQDNYHPFQPAEQAAVASGD